MLASRHGRLAVIATGLLALAAGAYLLTRALRDDDRHVLKPPPEVQRALEQAARQVRQTPADLAGRTTDVVAGKSGRGHIEVRVPAGDGGAPWATITWSSRSGQTCWQTGREPDMRALDLRLATNCRDLRDRRAVVWTVSRVSEVLTDARLAQLRAAGAAIPGATLVSGVASGDVRTLSVSAPGATPRRVKLSRRSRAFTTVYPTVLEKGRIRVRASLRGGESFTSASKLAPVHG